MDLQMEKLYKKFETYELLEKELIQNVEILAKLISNSNEEWIRSECRLRIREAECVAFEWPKRGLYCSVFSDGLQINKFNNITKHITNEFTCSDIQDNDNILSYLSSTC